MTQVKSLLHNDSAPERGYAHRIHRSKAGRTKYPTRKLTPNDIKQRAQYKRIITSILHEQE